MSKANKCREAILGEILAAQNLLTELDGKRTILKSHQREQSTVNVRDRGQQIKLLKQRVHDLDVELIVDPKSKKMVADKKALAAELEALQNLGTHHAGKAKAMADKLKQYRSERSKLQNTIRTLSAQLARAEQEALLEAYDPATSSVADLQTLIARQIHSAVVNGAGPGGIAWLTVQSEMFKLVFPGEKPSDSQHAAMMMALSFDDQIRTESALCGIPQPTKPHQQEASANG